MTSDGFTKECYVYMTLPGQTNSVTAGKFNLDTDRRGILTGRFVYGKSYLSRDDAVPIDPIELKLASRVYETVHLNGMFGALRGQIIGDVGSLNVMRESLNLERLIISFVPLMTVPEH